MSLLVFLPSGFSVYGTGVSVAGIIAAKSSTCENSSSATAGRSLSG
jgi:hypothetical protein